MILIDRVGDIPSSRTGLRGVISRNRLTSFFVLAYGVSWLAWTPYVLSRNGVGLLPWTFPPVLGTSQLLGVLPGAYLGPILAAYLVTRLSEGRAGVRRWLGRMARWRVSRWWYISIILGVPAMLVLTTIPFAGGLDAVRAPTLMVLVAYLPGLALQMITTGLAEEPGWRDFATPRLQSRFGALRGTLILGPLWGVWHLPLFLTEWGGWPNVRWDTPIVFILGAVMLSVVMTWVFNRTGESLPLAMLLHTSVNNYFTIAASAVFPLVDNHTSHYILLNASTTVAVFLIISTRGSLGYQGDSDQRHQIPH